MTILMPKEFKIMTLCGFTLSLLIFIIIFIIEKDKGIVIFSYMPKQYF